MGRTGLKGITIASAQGGDRRSGEAGMDTMVRMEAWCPQPPLDLTAHARVRCATRRRPPVPLDLSASVGHP